MPSIPQHPPVVTSTAPSSARRTVRIRCPSTATAPKALAAPHMARTEGLALKIPALAWNTASSPASAPRWYCGWRALASAAARRS